MSEGISFKIGISDKTNSKTNSKIEVTMAKKEITNVITTTATNPRVTRGTDNNNLEGQMTANTQGTTNSEGRATKVRMNRATPG